LSKADLFGIFEIDRVDLEQREIALAFFGSTDRPFYRIAGLEREATQLRGRNIDVVRTGQIIGVGRAQEAEPVLQNLDHTLADDLDILRRKLLQDGEHQLLLAHDVRVLDFMRFRESEKIGR
jgi:hypothetical protein